MTWLLGVGRAILELFSALAKWAGLFFAYRTGKRRAETEQLEQDLGDVETAKRARDALNDPAERKRVRDKYTRR